MVNIEYIKEVLENLTKDDVIEGLGRGVAVFYKTLLREGISEDFAKVLTHRYFIFLL